MKVKNHWLSEDAGCEKRMDRQVRVERTMNSYADWGDVVIAPTYFLFLSFLNTGSGTGSADNMMEGGAGDGLEGDNRRKRNF